jgi:hypothetical protein
MFIELLLLMAIMTSWWNAYADEVSWQLRRKLWTTRVPRFSVTWFPMTAVTSLVCPLDRQFRVFHSRLFLRLAIVFLVLSTTFDSVIELVAIAQLNNAVTARKRSVRTWIVRRRCRLINNFLFCIKATNRLQWNNLNRLMTEGPRLEIFRVV